MSCPHQPTVTRTSAVRLQVEVGQGLLIRADRIVTSVAAGNFMSICDVTAVPTDTVAVSSIACVPLLAPSGTGSPERSISRKRRFDSPMGAPSCDLNRLLCFHDIFRCY
jgi:hypothetical protein